tara:strand:+ start:2351 stop:2767 length:417 start_codon:yes stop_codon:yes gene_type:complete
MNIKGMLSGVAKNLEDVLIGNSVREIISEYPGAKGDLVKHFAASGLMTKILGPVKSLQIGLLKEIIDGTGKKLGGGTKGRTAGFSVDDLGADFVGAIGMSADTAYNKGMFSHTETADNMVGGQGVPKEVFKKIIKRVN